MSADAIARRRRWNPPLTAKMNWGHPMARDLKFFGCNGFDYVRHGLATLNGTLTPIATPQGQGNIATGAGYWEWATGLVVSGQTAWSAAFFGRVPAAGDMRIGQWGNNPNQSWLMQMQATPAVFVSAGATYPSLSGGSLAVNQYAVMSTSRNTAGTQSIYLDGRLAASGALAAQDAVANWPFQAINTPDSSAATTGLYEAVWHRELTASEHNLFAQDPFVLLRW